MKNIILMLTLLALAGCANTDTSWDRMGQGSHAPKIAESSIDNALSCIAAYAPENKFEIPKIAVGIIGNNTGAFDYEGLGNPVQLSISDSIISALKGAGLRVVARDGGTQAVIEWEMNLAMQKILGDGEMNTVWQSGPDGTGREIHIPYRILRAGDMLGSDLVLVGSINRLDFDNSSSGLEIYVNGYSLGRRTYSALVGMDLALVDTRSSEIVWAQQYSKSFFGLEHIGGVFKASDKNNLVDINFGVQTNDPLQAGVVDMASFAAYDVANYLFVAQGACDQTLEIGERIFARK